MLRHFFHVALRQIRNKPFFTFINVIGLALGLTACLLISVYVWEELNYDQYQAEGDRIYRLAVNFQQPSGSFSGPYVSAAVGKVLEETVPEVEETQRLAYQGDRLIVVPGAGTMEVPGVIFADPGFPALFSLNMIEGTQETALNGPHQALISQSLAQRLFPDQDPMGQKILLGGKADDHYTITGVMLDMPGRGHFRSDLLLSLTTLEASRGTSWLSFNFLTYLKMKPGAEADQLEAKFPALIEQYMGPGIEQAMGMSYAEFEASGSKVEFFLQPLRDIHLKSDLQGELAVNGSLETVQLFSLIAGFILLIAAINFINLSTARSANRAREVGLRKVLGARRKQLIGQFLGESVLLSLVATATAVIAAELALPFFNQLTGKTLHLPYDTPWFVLLVLGFTAVTGLLAGLYPAFYLSGFQPIGIITGERSSGASSRRLRQPLVILQFAISVGLILGSLSIYRQMQYLKNKDLGFDREQVLVVENTYTLGQEARLLRQQLAQLPEVQHASLTEYLPLNGIQNNRLHWPKQAGRSEGINLEFWVVDTSFVPTFGLELVEGRNFSDLAADSSAIILNRAAVEAYGWGESPLGQKLETFGSSGRASQTLEVIGVMENTHYEGFEQKIGPMAMRLGDSRGAISLRFEGQEVQTLIEKARKQWQSFAPNQPFQYSFMDERFAAFFQDTLRLGQIMLVFTGLAILVACLGLFALAAFLAEQRRQEIGIRKVLGASSAQILRLLSGEFVKLTAIALLIALPLTFWLLQDWISAYAYRIDLWRTAPWLALGAALLALLIAVATVSGQAIRAARVNPAEVLRDE